MISYERLEKRLKEKGLTKSSLTQNPGVSSRTIAKLAKGEKISRLTLQKIADFLVCDPADLYRVVSANPILQRLREEKEAKLPGGLYHELQVRMTYNSNHMEGSCLTEEQTRMIFETNTLDAGDGVPVDDILETLHHFRAVDYVIDVAEEVLTEEILKKLHYILKHDTQDATLAWFAIGDYKKRPNVVGGKKTTAPGEVAEKMQQLLARYNGKPIVTVNDIIGFHAEFEQIHPFQDGNGRVGRLIILKECLRHNVIPFIIEDSKKSFYYKGLANWNREKGWLTDTCLDGQDTFKKLLEMFEVESSVKSTFIGG